MTVVTVTSPTTREVECFGLWPRRSLWAEGRARSSADPDVGRGLPPGGTGPDSGRRSPVPEVGPGRISIRQPEARRAPFQSAQSAQRISPRSTPVNTHRGYRCRSRARTVARQQCSAVRVVLDQILAAQRLMIATGYLPGQIGVAVAGMQHVNCHHLNFDLLGKRLPVRKTPNDGESSVFAAVLDDPTSAGTQRVHPDHEPNPSRRK